MKETQNANLDGTKGQHQHKSLIHSYRTKVFCLLLPEFATRFDLQYVCVDSSGLLRVDVVSGLAMSHNRSVASGCRGTPGLTSLLMGWEVAFVVGGGAAVITWMSLQISFADIRF